MKKVLALVLALVLCLGVGAVSTASAESEPYEVVWHRYGTADQQGVAAVQEEVNKYLADKGLNITVDLSATYDGNTIQMRLAAKDHIDLFWSNASGTTNTLLAGNFLYDIGSIVKDYEGLYNSIPENIWNSVKRNGESIYQIPCYKEAGLAQSIVIKKSDAEKYGWDEIINDDHTKAWSYEDLIPYIEEAVAADEYYYPLYLGGLIQCNGSREYPLMDEFAAVTDFAAIDLSGDTTVVQKVTDIPAYQNLVKTMVQMNENGWISEEFLAGGYSSENSWLFLMETLTPDMQANMDGRYAKWDENGVYYINMSKAYLSSNAALGSAMSIASYCENIDAVMSLLNLYYSDADFADLCLYGIEGTNYNRLDDGTVEKIADSGYSFDTWATANVMTVSLVNTDSADKKEQYADFNSSTTDSILLGFVFDQTPVDAEVQACNAVKSEYQKMVEMGFAGEEGLQEYSDALDAAGCQTVLDEINAQWTAFLASK